jgi:large subunit ribosomal protein L18
LNEIYVQIIDDTKSHTLISASTVDKELKKKFKGMTKKEQAKLVGQTIADRAKDKGIKSVVFDRGGYKYIGRVEALADGARENGLQF